MNPSLSPAALLLLVGAAVFGLPHSGQSQVHTDFDGDQISDVTYVSASSTDLTWQSRASSEAGTTLSQTFGFATDSPVLAHWTGADSPDVAIVRTSGTRLQWRIDIGSGLLKTFQHGLAGDLVIAGADFDADGFSDAATLRIKDGHFLWSLRTRLMTTARTRSVRFGNLGDRAFFMRSTELRDQLAVFGPGSRGRGRLRMKDLTTKRVRTFQRFPVSLTRGTRPRPFPIRQDEGADHLGFLYDDGQDQTTLKIFSARGAKLQTLRFSGLASSVVGDFDEALPGEEVLLQFASKQVIVSPMSDELLEEAVISGTLIDEITVGATTAPTPTPTPTATATPT